MPSTDAVETSGIYNLRPQPTSPEDIKIDGVRESLNQCNDSPGRALVSKALPSGFLSYEVKLSS